MTQNEFLSTHLIQVLPGTGDVNVWEPVILHESFPAADNDHNAFRRGSDLAPLEQLRAIGAHGRRRGIGLVLSSEEHDSVQR